MPYLQHWVITHKPAGNQHLGKQMQGENWQEEPKISIIVYRREFCWAHFWPVRSSYCLLQPRAELSPGLQEEQSQSPDRLCAAAGRAAPRDEWEAAAHSRKSEPFCTTALPAQHFSVPLLCWCILNFSKEKLNFFSDRETRLNVSQNFFAMAGKLQAVFPNSFWQSMWGHTWNTMNCLCLVLKRSSGAPRLLKVLCQLTETLNTKSQDLCTHLRVSVSAKEKIWRSS